MVQESAITIIHGDMIKTPKLTQVYILPIYFTDKGGNIISLLSGNFILNFMVEKQIQLHPFGVRETYIVAENLCKGYLVLRLRMEKYLGTK